MTTKKNEIKKKDQSITERFLAKIITEYKNSIGNTNFTKSQTLLAQSYVIAMNSILAKTEHTRSISSSRSNEPPVTWANVNMDDNLILDIVSFAKMGLDPSLKNHLSIIPYLNKKTNKYDIRFMTEYRGMELVAKKYGLDTPDDVVIKMVHDNEEFIPIWQDINNNIETYVFNPAKNPFDESKIIGGFYYFKFKNNPEKNKLTVVTIKDIEKRKPVYAPVEFWGGEKDEWSNGKRTGKKIKVEGWYKKMVYKTLVRMAYSSITIDREKIDANYIRLKQNELEVTEKNLEQDIKKGANKESLDFDDAQVIEPEQLPEKTEEQQPKVENKEKPKEQPKTEKKEVSEKPLF